MTRQDGASESATESPALRAIDAQMTKVGRKLRSHLARLDRTMTTTRSNSIAPSGVVRELRRTRRDILAARTSIQRIEVKTRKEREGKRLALATLSAGAEALSSLRRFLLVRSPGDAKRALGAARASFAEMTLVARRLRGLLGTA